MCKDDLMNHNAKIRFALLIYVMLATWIAPAATNARERVASFAYVGCNRVGFGVQNPAPSTANATQLKQTLADIRPLPVRPKYFFFVGDMVLGMQADNGQTLAGEIFQCHWRDLTGPFHSDQLVKPSDVSCKEAPPRFRQNMTHKSPDYRPCHIFISKSQQF